MELLNSTEIHQIIEKLGILSDDVSNWRVTSYSDKLLGYLGEHLQLIIEVQLDGVNAEIKLFIKCIPRNDEWKADYLRKTHFFNKEYVVLSSLFTNFQENEGIRMWRPKLLYVKEDIFVFQDVTQDGYVMPCQYNYLSYNELQATVTTLAIFHAQSYIFEEKKSQELKRKYRIWEDYREYLKEPEKGKSWRNAGMKAVIDFLKVFSEYRFEPNFSTRVEIVITNLFGSAYDLMKPSLKHRNVVIHRDIWTNNIFFKKLENNDFHALLIDYQTVLYTPPMLDMASFMFFNTNNEFRITHTDVILKHYYNVLSAELRREDIDPVTIVEESKLLESYKESLLFGLTQAALIVPIIALTEEKKHQTFENPEVRAKINEISRSEVFIEMAYENESYRNRVLELFDEFVERYIFPTNSSYVMY